MFTDLLDDHSHRYKRKSYAALNEQYRQNLKCQLIDCTEDLTIFEGPGADKYCRDHQLKMVEYGGTGRADRPHRFYVKWVCDECGVDVSKEVIKKFPGLDIQNPALYNRLCRNRIIGDHQVRKADGGLDTESNIKSLCLNCNADKTIVNEDWRSGEKQINSTQGN